MRRRARKGAKEMIDGFGLAVPPNSTNAPALNTNHTPGKAIDMDITWTGTMKIKNKDGTEESGLIHGECQQEHEAACRRRILRGQETDDGRSALVARRPLRRNFLKAETFVARGRREIGFDERRQILARRSFQRAACFARRFSILSFRRRVRARERTGAGRSRGRISIRRTDRMVARILPRHLQPGPRARNYGRVGDHGGTSKGRAGTNPSSRPTPRRHVRRSCKEEQRSMPRRGCLLRT